MTDLLRSTLHDVAGEYPPVELGDDPWRRGRRARLEAAGVGGLAR